MQWVRQSKKPRLQTASEVSGGVANRIRTGDIQNHNLAL